MLELCSANGWDFMPSLDDADEKGDIADPNQALIARIVVLENEVAALKIAHAQVKEVSGTDKPDGWAKEGSGTGTPEVRNINGLELKL